MLALVSLLPALVLPTVPLRPMLRTPSRPIAAASPMPGPKMSLLETATSALLADEPPIPDAVLVGVALLLVAAVGALNLSLGDIVEDEANLPSSTNLINANRERRSAFIKGDTRGLNTSHISTSHRRLAPRVPVRLPARVDRQPATLRGVEPRARGDAATSVIAAPSGAAKEIVRVGSCARSVASATLIATTACEKSGGRS